MGFRGVYIDPRGPLHLPYLQATVDRCQLFYDNAFQAFDGDDDQWLEWALEDLVDAEFSVSLWWDDHDYWTSIEYAIAA